MLPLKVLSIKSLVPWGRMSLRNRNGFSAAELIVVMAVVAILAAIAIPWLTYVPAATVNAAARQVQSGLNQAKLLALTTRQNICVQLVPGGYRFLVGGAGAGCVVGGAPWTGADTDGAGTFRPWSANAITLAGPSPIFTPFGTATQTGVYTITGQGGTGTVTVLPSGRVTIP